MSVWLPSPDGLPLAGRPRPPAALRDAPPARRQGPSLPRHHQPVGSQCGAFDWACTSCCGARLRQGCSRGRLRLRKPVNVKRADAAGPPKRADAAGAMRAPGLAVRVVDAADAVAVEIGQHLRRPHAPGRGSACRFAETKGSASVDLGYWPLPRFLVARRPRAAPGSAASLT